MWLGHVRWCVEYLLYDTAGLLRKRRKLLSLPLPHEKGAPAKYLGDFEFCFEAQSEAFACLIFFLLLPLSGLDKDGNGCNWRIYQKLLDGRGLTRTWYPGQGQERYHNGQPIKYTGFNGIVLSEYYLLGSRCYYYCF